MLLYIPGIIAVAWFLRQILTGKILPQGILEVEPEQAVHVIHTDPAPEGNGVPPDR